MHDSANSDLRMLTTCMCKAVLSTARRVLVFAPLARYGLDVRVPAPNRNSRIHLRFVTHLVGELGKGADAIILTEEALDDPDFPGLPAALEQQAAWSDIPVILFAGDEQSSASLRTIGLAETLRNVTFIDCPIRSAAVVSVVRAGIRARARQVRTARHARGAARRTHRGGGGQPAQGRIPGDALPRAADAAQRDSWLDADAAASAAVDDRRRSSARWRYRAQRRAQAQLIEDLLDVSRIITGKLVSSRAGGPRRGRRRRDRRDSAGGRGEAIAIARPCSPRRRAVYGDADRLQQVVWNLLSNAVKFTPHGGTVTVSLQLVDSHAVLAVSDTGPGLAPIFYRSCSIASGRRTRA